LLTWNFIFVVNSGACPNVQFTYVTCRWHADRMTELETKAALRLLAARYVVQAAAIEMTELNGHDI
jgi:hypothetical protein